MEYGSDEYWEARRAELRRARNRREFAKLLEATMQALAALIAIGLLVWFCFQVAERPVNERAAWLEGDGLDPATARALARQGFGKTAAEVAGEEVRSKKEEVRSAEGEVRSKKEEVRSAEFGDLRPAGLVSAKRAGRQIPHFFLLPSSFFLLSKGVL